MSGYQERYAAWWELRALLSDALPYADFAALLRDIDEPLRAYLEPPPPPKMAFDEVADPAIVALVAAALARLANGECERSVIEAASRWAEKAMRAVDCEIKPGSHSNKMVRAYMQRRVAEWPDDLPTPTETEDVKALRQQFPALTRNEARIVRTEEAPSEWWRQGPRKAWGAVKQGYQSGNPPIRQSAR